jgi:hypothetical protein
VNRFLGRSVARLEDPPLLTGRGAFVGDIGFPRQLHMRIVRSPYANAVLRSLDIAEGAGRAGNNPVHPEPRARVHPVRLKLSRRQADDRLLRLQFTIIIARGNLRPCRGQSYVPVFGLLLPDRT